MKLNLHFFTSLFFASCLLFPAEGNAQKQIPDLAIQVAGGYSHHGIGDMDGIVFGTEYIKYHSKKFALNYNFRGSINNSKHTIFVTDTYSGTAKDASIRFTTAGIQVGINGQYSFVRNLKHQFSIALGAFGRYQSASNGTDGYSLYGPNVTGIPTILVGYDNSSPQKTYSLGGIFQLQYDYAINNRVFIGLAPGLQTDTNGDVIPQAVLVVGRRF